MTLSNEEVLIITQYDGQITAKIKLLPACHPPPSVDWPEIELQAQVPEGPQMRKSREEQGIVAAPQPFP